MDTGIWIAIRQLGGHAKTVTKRPNADSNEHGSKHTCVQDVRWAHPEPEVLATEQSNLRPARVDDNDSVRACSRSHGEYLISGDKLGAEGRRPMCTMPFDQNRL